MRVGGIQLGNISFWVRLYKCQMCECVCVEILIVLIVTCGCGVMKVFDLFIRFGSQTNRNESSRIEQNRLSWPSPKYGFIVILCENNIFGGFLW